MGGGGTSLLLVRSERMESDGGEFVSPKKHEPTKNCVKKPVKMAQRIQCEGSVELYVPRFPPISCYWNMLDWAQS